MKKLLCILLLAAMSLNFGCSAVFDTVTAYADKVYAPHSAAEEMTFEEEPETAVLPSPAESLPYAPETLSIYTCMADSEWPFFINAFIEKTGVEVYCLSMSEEALLNRLKAEAAEPKASVILGGSSDFYEKLAEEGLLQSYTSPSLAMIPEEYRDKEGNWTPIYADAAAFVFNENYFRSKNWEKPRTWADLTKGSYGGGIILAHPSYDDLMYEFLAILNQQMGSTDCRHYMRDLSSTVAYYSRTTEQALHAVASGAAGITLAYSEDALHYTTPEGGNAELSVYFPVEGSICKISAAALVKGGVKGEENNARAFLDFMAGKDGQDVIQKTKTYHIPVNTQAMTDPALIPIGELILADYNEKTAQREKQSIRDDFLARIDDGSGIRDN